MKKSSLLRVFALQLCVSRSHGHRSPFLPSGGGHGGGGGCTVAGRVSRRWRRGPLCLRRRRLCGYGGGRYGYRGAGYYARSDTTVGAGATTEAWRVSGLPWLRSLWLRLRLRMGIRPWLRLGVAIRVSLRLRLRPWWTPDYYPYYAPYGYPYPYNGDDAPPPDPGPKSRDNAPVKPSRAPAPESSPSTNSVTSNVAAFTPTAPLQITDGTITTASNYRLAHSTMQ